MACLYFFAVCRHDYGNSELNLAIWQDDPIALKLPLRTRSDGGQRSSRALRETDAFRARPDSVRVGDGLAPPTLCCSKTHRYSIRPLRSSAKTNTQFLRARVLVAS